MTEHLPTPPWRDGTKPRRRLDRESIGREALRIIDAEGIDAVSMRRVAAAFDTGPASLYAHVENKEALLRLAFDLAIEELEPVPAGSEDWQAGGARLEPRRARHAGPAQRHRQADLRARPQR